MFVAICLQAQQALMRQQRNTTATTTGAYLTTQIQGAVMQQQTNAVVTTHIPQTALQAQVQNQQLTAIPQQVQVRHKFSFCFSNISDY